MEDGVLRLAFEHAPVAMGLIDAHGRWLAVNAALCRLTGLGREELLTLNLPALMHEDAEAQAGRFAAFLSGTMRQYADELRLRDAVGGTVWVSLGAARVDAPESPRAYAVVRLEDVTQQRQIETLLAARALHDPLTGMGNRVLLMERLQQALEDGGRVALLFVDLDRFKTVNDTHGHDVGDRVLVEVARRIQANLRAGDTAARLGGDEFIVLCTGVRSAADVTELVERLQTRIREPIGANGQYVSVSMSVGVVCPEGMVESGEGLLRQADLAMYRAKQLGRGRMALFDQGLEDHLERRLRLEHGLHEAFRSRQFEVWYQPLVDLRDGGVAGAEALVRWRHPERGMLAPGAFLEVAEETGMIVPLGDWVLEHAAEQMVGWHRALGRPLDLSVNVSARQLDRPTWPAAVAEVLERTGLPPSNLHLELTETAMFGSGASTVGAFRGLRAQGVHIGIDDFGTGYSSMQYLRDFPVDFLKVDRAFVSELGGASREPSAIVEAILALGRALGLRTVGEGVETLAQAQRLGLLGCDLAQGYLLGEPMPAEQFAGLLAREARVLRAVPQAAGA